jgi:ribosomal protein S18 acetylase RimI-like enzyme
VSDPGGHELTSGALDRAKMTTSIRKALASDAAGLIELTRRTISASYRPFLGDQTVDGFLESGAADDYVRENLDCCSVITHADQVVGYAVCRANLIDLMMIDLTSQRRGFGTELLHRVEESLAPSYEELTLESFEVNHPANAFYRKHGWSEVTRYLDSDSGVGKIVFRKFTGLTRP